MPRAALLPLVLVALLAGCLEERAAPPSPGPGAGLQFPPTDLPVPPVPSPPLGRTEVILRGTYPLGGAPPAPFVVPEEATELRATIRWNDTWQGEVVLSPPVAAPGGTCAEEACEISVPDPAPGEWRILLPNGTGSEVEVVVRVVLPPPPVSPKPVPTPPTATPTSPTTPTSSPKPTPPPLGELEPQHALRRNAAFDGRLNQSDFVTVLPSHRLMRVWLALDVENAGNYAPRVSLGEPTPQGYHDFGRSCVDECFIDVEYPAPGSWWILMGGEGRGTAVANVTLFEDRAARTDEPVAVYANAHSDHSHAMRGEFEEGFSLPPGFALLSIDVRALGEAADPAADPRVQVLRPDGSVAVDCDLAAAPSCHVVAQAPEPGAWRVRWLGTDAARAAETVVRADPAA